MIDDAIRRDLSTAMRLMEVGNADAAIDSLRRVLSEDPDQGDVHALLALCLVARGRLHAAHHEAKIALAVFPESALAHRAMARVLLARRRLREARTHVERLIDADPTDPDGFQLRADLHDLEGDGAAMVRDLAKVLELDPENVEARVDLGHHHLARGRLALAEIESHAALAIDPEDHRALLLRGWLALRRGDPAEARDHAVWVLRDDPSDRGALQLLAAIKARQSPLLGLWWRWNVWMGELGQGRAIVVLLVAFMVYRAATIFVGSDLQHPEAASAIHIAWLGVVAYTWIGPTLFLRRLRAELATLRLDDF